LKTVWGEVKDREGEEEKEKKDNNDYYYGLK
jgi:hypothetical protein